MTYYIKYPRCPKCGSDDVDLYMNDIYKFVAYCEICGFTGGARRAEGNAFRAFIEGKE